MMRSRPTTSFRAFKTLLLTLITTATLAQNSMIGDGFGGRLWYRPTNYTVGSYSAFSICYSDPCDGATNQLYGWGGDNVGEMANGPTANCVSTPVAIPGMNDVRYFNTGYWMGVIKNDDTGWVWGGDGGSTYPTQVMTDVKFVDASARLVTFVKNDGTVWSIGFNDFGQFGDGTTTSNYATPVQMIGVTNAVRVAVGLFASYVLLADGSVVSAGSTTWGLLGDPANMVGATIAAPVPGLANVVDLKATAVSGAALISNGDVYAWGSGGYSGDGDSFNDTLPKRLPELTNIVAISGCTDGDHVLALGVDKSCWVFGQYNFNTVHLLPELIATNVIDIMAGETFSYIVKADGTLWASGSSLCGSIWMDQPNFIHPAVNQVLTQLHPSSVPGSCPLAGTVAVPNATCSTGSITIYHFGGVAPYTYDIGNGPQTSNVFADVPLGNYMVSVTDANACVTTVPCTVDPVGMAPIPVDMGTVSACVDEGFALPSGAVVFASGIYSDTTFSILGCDTVRVFDVEIVPLPVLHLQITLCEGETYTLPNGDVVIAPGVFFIDTLEYADACDTLFSISLVLSALPPLVAQVATADSSITSGESVILSPSPGSSFNWYPSTGLSCTDCTFPLASPTETTQYCVVVSDNIFSCGTDTACLTITVSALPAPTCTTANIFIPTAFSPNANGTNDMQCVHGAECITSMSFNIYDRWGNKVFASTDPNACWDGTYNGQPLDPAVFVYHLSAALSNGESVERQGNITLMR